MKNEFIERFANSSKEELVDLLNEDCFNPGWVGARGRFHIALSDAFRERGIDPQNVNFKNFWKLEGNKLVPCSQPRLTIEYQVINDSSVKSYSEVNGMVRLNRVLQPVSSPNVLKEVFGPRYFELTKVEPFLFDVSNINEMFQVITIDDDNVVQSVSMLIGHKQHKFHQQVYGRRFIVIPVKERYTKKALVGSQVLLEIWRGTKPDL